MDYFPSSLGSSRMTILFKTHARRSLHVHDSFNPQGSMACHATLPPDHIVRRLKGESFVFPRFPLVKFSVSFAMYIIVDSYMFRTGEVVCIYVSKYLVVEMECIAF